MDKFRQGRRRRAGRCQVDVNDVSDGFIARHDEYLSVVHEEAARTESWYKSKVSPPPKGTVVRSLRKSWLPGVVKDAREGCGGWLRRW